MGLKENIRHPIKALKKTIALYDDLICTQLIKRTSRECLNKQPPKDSVIVDFCGLYDHVNISYYYLFQSFPQELPLEFKDMIRRACVGATRVSFFDVIYSHKIDWYSPAMRSRLRIMRENSEMQSEKSVNAFNLHDNILNMSRQSYIEESLAYMVEADLKRGKAIVATSMCMAIMGERGEEFDETVGAIEEYCEHIGIKLERVLYDIPDIVGYYSPFRHQRTMNKISAIPTHIMTEEQISRFSSYGQGILGVGSERATYFGTDIYSGFPILKKTKGTNESAEIWLVTAEVGGGKSFYVKCLILQLIALNMRGTIMDVEGTEYLPLAQFCSKKSKVVVLNMGEGVGRYFDPLEIAEATGDEEIDKEAYTMAVSFTTAILKVLLGEAYKASLMVKNVIELAVALTYDRYGVSQFDRRTWVLSKGMTLRSVYDTIRLFNSYYKVGTAEKQKILSQKYHISFDNIAFENPDFQEAVLLVLSVLSTYLSDKGLNASFFEQRVLLQEIKDADLVVCSFGMAGKSMSAVDAVQLNLMQLSAAQISHQRSIFSKARGRFNFKVWEEFQRWGKFPDSKNTIGTAITGGRKLGDVNIVITNVVKELLEQDSCGIMGNISSFMVGAITDSHVRAELASRLSVPNMLPELDRIASAARSTDEYQHSSKGAGSVYRFSFLVGLDTEKYGIAKMLLPPKMARSELFRTGVITEEERAGQEQEHEHPQENPQKVSLAKPI